MTRRLVTFDVYTALFDIEGSLTPVVRAALGAGADSRAFVGAWRRKQLEWVLISNSLGGARLSFESITRRALDDTLARAALELPAGVRSDLVDAWLALQPWPEAPAAVEAARARGCTIGLLSNGDEGMLRALLPRLPRAIDFVFSSEQAGYYKPHPAVYALPVDRLHLPAAGILHVAGSATDVLGTKAAGLTCVWSNRYREPLPDPGHPPDHVIDDLGGLDGILGR